MNFQETTWITFEQHKAEEDMIKFIDNTKQAKKIHLSEVAAGQAFEYDSNIFIKAAKVGGLLEYRNGISNTLNAFWVSKYIGTPCTIQETMLVTLVNLTIEATR